MDTSRQPIQQQHSEQDNDGLSELEEDWVA